MSMTSSNVSHLEQGLKLRYCESTSPWRWKPFTCRSYYSLVARVQASISLYFLSSVIPLSSGPWEEAFSSYCAAVVEMTPHCVVFAIFSFVSGCPIQLSPPGEAAYTGVRGYTKNLTMVFVNGESFVNASASQRIPFNRNG